VIFLIIKFFLIDLNLHSADFYIMQLLDLNNKFTV